MSSKLLKAGTRGLAIAATYLVASASQAAIFGSLAYVDQTGTVNADESIEVWVTLTLDQFSDPLAWNRNLSFPEGIDPLPQTGYSYDQNVDGIPFAQYDEIIQSLGRSCTDTFVSSPGSCSGGPYVNDPTLAPNAWLDYESLTLQPGEGVDILLTFLDPIGGIAPDGTYYLPNVYLTLEVRGQDEFGGELYGDILQATTNCFDNSCAFTRNVVSPVPVPAAAWLFASALLGLGAVKRKKS